MTILWPGAVLSPISINVDFPPQPVGGTPSLSGNRQWVQSDAGCWSIIYTNVNVGSTQKVKCWHAMEALLNGPVTPVLVPTFDDLRAPWPIVGGVTIRSYGPIKYGDGITFSDGSCFFQPVIIAAISGDRDLRANVIAISVSFGSALEGGQQFSIGERLYRIASIASASAGIYICNIIPPLREAAPDETQVNFDSPVVRCRLIDGNQMKLSLQANLIGTQTVEFIEDL